MISVIENLLKNNPLVSAYKIIENKKDCVELYYVLDKLETNRVIKTKEYSVFVYHDFDSYRGSSDFIVNDDFSACDINAKIDEALKRCLFVKNKFFELPKKEKNGSFDYTFKSNDSKDEIACKVADSIFKANTYKDGWINSCEIYVNYYEKRVVNSNGVDLCSKNSNIFVELIPTFKSENEEVEVYDSFKTSSLDYELITKRVDETMKNAYARSRAMHLPKDLKKCNVIIPTEVSSMLFTSFVNNLNYSKHFMHMNLLNIGDDISNGCGDKIDITLKPSVVSSSESCAFDDDGVVLYDSHIIDNGKCMMLHGSNKFGYYMNALRPTGAYKNIEVKKGSMSYSDMTKEPYIYCVCFSSPQLDEYSGYYGGEIRLGYYFDGQNVIPVTGFSISGNLNEDRANFKLSTEIETNNTYRGPKYVLIENMTINN